MTRTRLFHPRRDSSWDDQSGDSLVSRLDRLAAMPPDLEERVARNRSLMRARFAEAHLRQSPLPRRAMAQRRLALAFALAALLVSVSVGGIAASSPGRPLFAVRLAVEDLLLPSDASARLLAQLDRLDQRLDEATTVVAAGDLPAAADALRAYGEIAMDVKARAAPDGLARSTAVARVASQLQRLLRLQMTVGAPSSAESLRSANGMLDWLRARQGEGIVPAPGSRLRPTLTPEATPTAHPSPDGGGGLGGTQGPGSSGSQEASDRPSGSGDPGGWNGP